MSANRATMAVGGLVVLVWLAATAGQQRAESETLTATAHAAVTPAHRFNWWGARHEQILERVRKGDVDLVFLGDSITQGWERSGRKVWQEYYGRRKAINLGFDGDRTQHVLWRLEHGEVDGLSPRAVVVLIGINNIGENTADQIADGIKAVVSMLRDKLPRTKILLMGVFPYQQNPGGLRDKIKQVNLLAAQLADGRTIHHLDIGDQFLRPDGMLPPQVMPDFLHPNEKGYRIWAKAIEPKLAELLGEGSRADDPTPAGAVE